MECRCLVTVDICEVMFSILVMWSEVVAEGIGGVRPVVLVSSLGFVEHTVLMLSPLIQATAVCTL